MQTCKSDNTGTPQRPEGGGLRVVSSKRRAGAPLCEQSAAILKLARRLAGVSVSDVTLLLDCPNAEAAWRVNDLRRYGHLRASARVVGKSSRYWTVPEVADGALGYRTLVLSNSGPNGRSPT